MVILLTISINQEDVPWRMLLELELFILMTYQSYVGYHRIYG